MKQSAFTLLKATCHRACHERHACPHGYRELMSASNAEQIASVWNRYWRELVSVQYADIICQEFPPLYLQLRSDFNQAGVYYNECPTGSFIHPMILIGHSDNPIHIFGQSKAYVLGKSHVVAHDHSYVSCAQPDGIVELLDASQCDISEGYAIARSSSFLQSSTSCECHDASRVSLTHDATLHDHGHRLIHAYHSSTVTSPSTLGITLHDQSRIVPPPS